MKKLSSSILVLSLILMLFSCSNDDILIGSNNITSEVRDVTAFSKVSSEGSFTVNIIQGSAQSLEVHANNNFINKLKTSVSNNKLRIYLLDGSYSNTEIEVIITVPNLNELQNNGSGDISVNGLNSQGNLQVKNFGSGSISISGSVNNLNIINEGSGAFHGAQFMSTNTEVKNYGSGDCQIYSTAILNVKIEGSGDVYYTGNPSINTNISGSGNIINAN